MNDNSCPRCVVGQKVEEALWPTWSCGSDRPDFGPDSDRTNVFRQSRECLEGQRDHLQQELNRVNAEADECMAALDQVHMEFCVAVEKATRSAPLDREAAISVIARLGNERDHYRLTIEKLVPDLMEAA